MKEIILQAIKFAKERMKNNRDGHDYYHAERVYKKAVHLAEKEGCNVFICGLAAILHDIDHQSVLNVAENPEDCTCVREFLQTLALDVKDIDLVCDIINYVSNRASAHHMKDKKEAWVVSDANALDAIGAIGVARAFAWGSSRRQIMYNGDVSDENTIKYFYDKLIPLSENMKTETGKELAIQRKEFMESFLQEFYYEWTL